MGTDGEPELLLVAANILDRIDGFSCSICPRIVLGAQCNNLLGIVIDVARCSRAEDQADVRCALRIADSFEDL